MSALFGAVESNASFLENKTLPGGTGPMGSWVPGLDTGLLWPRQTHGGYLPGSHEMLLKQYAGKSFSCYNS
jgi:hypothetical protein